MEGILTMSASRSLRRLRGSSFLEILIALAIIAILMVGILQMFALALITNRGSAARTDLLYKAQQVVENLRLVYYLETVLGNNAARVESGVPATISATAGPIYLPYDAGGADPMTAGVDDPDTDLTWDYWGPRGANLVEAEKLPYRLSYTVEARDADFWLITVTATPVDNPNLVGTYPAVTNDANPRRYLDPGSRLKIVTYAAQIAR